MADRLGSRKENKRVRQVPRQPLGDRACVRVQDCIDRVIPLMDALVKHGFEPGPTCRPRTCVRRDDEQAAVCRVRAAPRRVHDDMDWIALRRPRQSVCADDEVQHRRTVGGDQLLGGGHPRVVGCAMRWPPRFAINRRRALEDGPH